MDCEFILTLTFMKLISVNSIQTLMQINYRLPVTKINAMS